MIDTPKEYKLKLDYVAFTVYDMDMPPEKVVPYDTALTLIKELYDKLKKVKQ